MGGIASILVQIAALTSGMWFDVRLVGGVFLGISKVLPFLHAVELVRGAASGNLTSLFPGLMIVLAWAVGFFALAVLVFRRRMKSL